MVKRREAANAISELFDNDGVCVNKQEDIEVQAVDFYQKLYNKNHEAYIPEDLK